jgi:hypothetical protein
MDLAAIQDWMKDRRERTMASDHIRAIDALAMTLNGSELPIAAAEQQSISFLGHAVRCSSCVWISAKPAPPDRSLTRNVYATRHKGYERVVINRTKWFRLLAGPPGITIRLMR